MSHINEVIESLTSQPDDWEEVEGEDRIKHKHHPMSVYPFPPMTIGEWPGATYEGLSASDRLRLLTALQLWAGGDS